MNELIILSILGGCGGLAFLIGAPITYIQYRLEGGTENFFQYIFDENEF